MSKSLKFMVVVLTLILAAGQVHAFRSMTSPETQTANPKSEFTKGKVVETMSAGSYTYLRLENNGEKRWVAIPASEVKVGDEVEIAAGNEFYNFQSRSLGRTFDTIIFSRGLVSNP